MKKTVTAVIDNSNKIIALCFGAEHGPGKRWPVYYFADIARYKLAEGWLVRFFGSDRDKGIAERISRDANGLCLDFTGRTSSAEKAHTRYPIEIRPNRVLELINGNCPDSTCALP